MASESRERISKAMTALVLDHAFFAALALRLKIVETSACPTGYVNGEEIGFNPDWIKGLRDKQIQGFLAHEVMHLAMTHHTRMLDRDHEWWNIAGDFAINNILKEAGMELPDTQCIDPKYKDMAAEEVYDIVYDSTKKPKGPKQDPGGCGGIKPMEGKDGGKPSPNDIKKEEEDWKIATIAAANAAKQQGELPGHLKSFIDELKAPKLDWREILREFVEVSAKNDYTWKTPNRRYLQSGIILPSLLSKELGTAVIVVDTSGSVSKVELEQFAGEISSILEEYNDITIQVIYCDTRVAHVEEFHSSDLPIQMKMHGGGGTDFKPPFAWVRKNLDEAPTCLLYFTDLECHSYPKDPGYPTIWIWTKTQWTNSSWKSKPPFGQVVAMDMRNDK